MSQKNSVAYAYNPQELLRQVGTSTVLDWDAKSRRVRLTVGNDVYQFVYDPTASIPAVVQEFGPDGRNIVYVREPDGKLLASGGERLRWQGKVLRKRANIGGAVMISDADTGERLWYKQFRKSRVWSVAFSPDGKLLAAGFDNGIVKVWRIRYTEKPDPR